MKLKITSILIVFFLLFGSGVVKDDYEPEKRVIVTALLIESQNDSLQLTAEVSLPNKEGGNEIRVYGAKSNNIENALFELEKASYGKLFLSQCPVILFEKSLSKEAFKGCLYYLFTSNEISLAVKLVAVENGKELLSNDTKIPAGYEIENLLNNIERTENKRRLESFAEIIDKSKSNNMEFSLPFIKKQDGRFIVDGYCRYVDFLLYRKEEII